MRERPAPRHDMATGSFSKLTRSMASKFLPERTPLVFLTHLNGRHDGLRRPECELLNREQNTGFAFDSEEIEK